MPLDAEYVRAVSSAAENHTRTILETGTTEGIAVRGQQVVLVTVRGAKTGTLRKVPVMRVEHDGVYAMVASLGGAPKNPAWYHSIKVEPDVELQDGTRTRAFAAREVTGDEKAVWWERAVAAYPEYAEYQRKTEREIPVFVLEPTLEDRRPPAR